MNRAIGIGVSWVVAGAAGILVGDMVCRSSACRDALGVAFSRGHIVALTQGEGIYEADLNRELDQVSFVSGQKHAGAVDPAVKRAALSRLIETASLRGLAKNETVPSGQVNSRMEIGQRQFPNQKTRADAITSNHLNIRTVRAEIIAAARAEKAMEREIEKETGVGDDECRRFFETHQELFVLPERLRASHLFLAAPEETPDEIADLKRRTIDSFSVRLSHGDDFLELVSQASEDEASKKEGGDLGVFSKARMSSDFVSIVETMKVGTTSPPFQTGLGFHIVRLTDRLPARRMTFQEAEPEIRLKLQNERRSRIAKSLAARYLKKATVLQSRL